jgi:hypothetical protein
MTHISIVYSPVGRKQRENFQERFRSMRRIFTDVSDHSVLLSLPHNIKVESACTILAETLHLAPGSTRLIASPDEDAAFYCGHWIVSHLSTTKPLYQVISKNRSPRHLQQIPRRVQTAIGSADYCGAPQASSAYQSYHKYVHQIPGDIEVRLRQVLNVGYTRNDAMTALMLTQYDVRAASELRFDRQMWREAEARFMDVGGAEMNIPPAQIANTPGAPAQPQNLPVRIRLAVTKPVIAIPDATRNQGESGRARRGSQAAPVRGKPARRIVKEPVRGRPR